MTIKDLKDAIKEFPDDMEVIMQKDGEGNGYSPLDSLDDSCIYVADSTWSGSVFDVNWSADDVGMSEREWREMKKKPRALLLYPVN